MQRVRGCEVIAHVGRIEDKPDDFYEQFTVIVLGLDSLEARRYMNRVVCSFLGVLSSACQTLQMLSKGTLQFSCIRVMARHFLCGMHFIQCRHALS
jgi:molybdopterin/thiamine biosynthesis adenylyltransferase